MSQALVRVIVQQQKEIDRLKARDKSSLEAWSREHVKREALVGAVFKRCALRRAMKDKKPPKENT